MSIENHIYFLWQKSPFKSLIYLLAHEDAGAGVVVVVVVVVVTVVVVVGGGVVVVMVVVVVDMVVVIFSPTLPPPSESGFLSSEQKWSQVFKIIVLEVSDDMRMKVCFLKHLAKAKKTANNRHQHEKQQKSSGAFQEQM